MPPHNAPVASLESKAEQSTNNTGAETMTPLQEHLAEYPEAKRVFDLYLEYRNDYLTSSRFAANKGFSIEFALDVIDEGRRLHMMNDNTTQERTR
jgi:hypothetical protein